MPVFGYNTAGASRSAFQDDIGIRYGSPASSGTTDNIEAYFDRVDGGNNDITVALYNYTSATDVGTLIGQNTFTNQSGNDAGSWQTNTISQSVTGGTNYFLLWAVDSGAVMWLHFDTGGSTSATSKRTIGYTSGTWTFASPFTGEGTSTVDISIRCNYTATGGLGIPIASYHYNHNTGSNL
jgi:hypothetical protein